MDTPVVMSFNEEEEEELATIDRLVADGLGDDRSDVIHQAVNQLEDGSQRADIGQAIVESYRKRPQTSEDDAMAMANAIALTEAEPW